MTKEAYLKIKQALDLVRRGESEKAESVLIGLINSTRNYSIDYSPEWEEDAKG